MNEKKNAEKSTRVKKQKAPGEKLVSEKTKKAAYRKKLRYGKKNNVMSVDEKMELERYHTSGRKRIRMEHIASVELNQKLQEENAEDSAAKDSINSVISASELAVRNASKDRYAGKLHKKAEKKAATHEKQKQSLWDESKEIQKKLNHKRISERIQKRRATEAAASKKTVDKAENLVGKMGEYMQEHILDNPKMIISLGVVFLVVMIVVTGFSSCTVMGGGVGDVTLATSFTAEDEAILAVDEDYTQLEEDLLERINEIETVYPGYDEYQYTLDEIGHNPYQLAALLTVLYEDYTQAEVQNMLQIIFDAQYELAVTEVVEIRTRTEDRTGYRMVWNPDNEEYELEEYTYQVEVEYEYYILKVNLSNDTLETVVSNMGLTTDQMERYEILLLTYGNKPYLFGDDIYSVVDPGEYTDYDIPPELLTDTEFANMIQCAERYLGLPYVWGGSSPSTGFDCSGFVSYVINHSGNGWNVGRKTANGLLNGCSRVSSAEVKPGDLVFFKNTYNVNGASHVGIYVGNGMMLHCGNPIQYTSINTSYWQEHFYTYGRIN